jgi:hypothetical protein
VGSQREQARREKRMRHWSCELATILQWAMKRWGPRSWARALMGAQREEGELESRGFTEKVATVASNTGDASNPEAHTFLANQ